ncbi:MAG: ribokinase [Clostridia bacterium]|nr:ribokinase [Clostridia bacterium]
MKKRILVVSSANMDMVMNINTVPSAGETVIENGSYAYVPGGKGANSAVAISRLGAECTFLTRVGNDANANSLLELYKKEEIDISYIKKDDNAPTGLATIFVEKNGQNRIIVFAGANQKIDRETVSEALNDAPDALYMQFEINHDAILHAANEAYKKGIPVFIDAGPADKTFPLEKLPRLEIFSPNETETLGFTGIAPTDDDACMRACLELQKRIDAKYIVIKLGSKGAYVFDGEKGEMFPSYEIKAVDTTAAGDAFTAALTLKYLQCQDIALSCKFANCAGALTVSRHGASSSIPSLDETQAFFEKVIM